MREIDVAQVQDAVHKLFIKANHILGDDVICAIKNSINTEVSPLGKDILEKLVENIEVSKEINVPICQDTGMAVVFLEVGQDVHFIGGSLDEAINQGVETAYVDGYLRLSVVGDPIKRENTNTNTPAIIHTKIVQGDKVKITAAPKGFGSENMSRLKMFTPSATVSDIIDFVVETVNIASSNPCPPIVVGIGIGGSFEKCALLAKEALMIPLDKHNSDYFYADLEEKILEKINKTGIGPQGTGGSTTALGVKIKTFATHIAGLPVAVNINCHVTRHCDTII